MTTLQVSRAVQRFTNIYPVVVGLFVIAKLTANVVQVAPMSNQALAHLAVEYPHKWYQWNVLVTYQPFVFHWWYWVIIGLPLPVINWAMYGVLTYLLNKEDIK